MIKIDTKCKTLQAMRFAKLQPVAFKTKLHKDDEDPECCILEASTDIASCLSTSFSRKSECLLFIYGVCR